MQDFDFHAYVLKRRGEVSKGDFHLQNYAYLEDIERLRQLSQRDIVRQALQLGLQAWKLARLRAIQSHSQPISSDDPTAKIWSDVCFTFRHTPLPMRLMPSQKAFIAPWGGDEGTFYTLSPAGYTLPTTALKFVFGRGIGALDNSHVPWMTLSYFIDDLTRGLWNKVTQIPDILLHWKRCAIITQDRAGLLATRDMSGAIYAILKESLDWTDTEIMSELRRYHEKRDVDWGENDVEKRIRALELFTESRIYKRSSGRPISDIDADVQKLYSIFGD